MAVRVSAASVIVRNSSVESRLPGGMVFFVRLVPNSTLCSDGKISRVAFMVSEDARTFINRLVSAGLVASPDKTHEEIALVQEGRGFCFPCDWLQLGLFEGHPCAWLAGADRGNLYLLEHERSGKVQTMASGEFDRTHERIGFKARGRIDVYRHKESCEIRYVSRPFRPAKKWWEFWKLRQEAPVDGANYDEISREALDLVRPFVEHQLSMAALDGPSQKQLRLAREKLERLLEFSPNDWRALWTLGIANKCLHEVDAAYVDFQRAYAIEKNEEIVGRELVGICIALGKGDEAVRISREVLQKHPNDAGLISNYALALVIAGYLSEAETTVQNALQMDPNDQITQSLARWIASLCQNPLARPNRWPLRIA